MDRIYNENLHWSYGYFIAQYCGSDPEKSKYICYPSGLTGTYKSSTMHVPWIGTKALSSLKKQL